MKRFNALMFGAVMLTSLSFGSNASAEVPSRSASDNTRCMEWEEYEFLCWMLDECVSEDWTAEELELLAYLVLDDDPSDRGDTIPVDSFSINFSKIEF
ncbi:MAG: hypothetical protein MI861_29240 [Pirellulales bacterium]|nr:hypothetical protein [Pirellulales bacterium]